MCNRMQAFSTQQRSTVVPVNSNQQFNLKYVFKFAFHHIIFSNFVLLDVVEKL